MDDPRAIHGVMYGLSASEARLMVFVSYISEQLQLLYCLRVFYQFMSPEYFHHAKLLVGHTHNTHMPFGRQDFFDPADVYIGILPAAAVPQIDAELEHLEAITLYLFTEQGIVLPVLFGVSRQVEKY